MIFRKILLFIFVLCFLITIVRSLSREEEMIQVERLKLETTKEGEEFYAKRNFIEAKKKFFLSLEQNPQLGLSFFYLGLIFDYEKLRDESVIYLKKSLERILNKEFITVALWKLIYYYYNNKDYYMTVHYIKEIRQAGVSSSKLDKIENEVLPLLNPSKIKAIVKFQNYSTEYEQIKVEQEKIENNGSGVLLEGFQAKLRNLARLLSKIVVFDISYAEHVFEVGLLLEKFKLYDDAIYLYQNISNKIQYSELPKIMDILSRVQYKLGFLHKRKSNFLLSVFYLQNLVNSDLQNKDLLKFSMINLAQSLYAQKKYNEAFDLIYKVVFKKDTTSSDSQQSTGYLFCLIYTKKILNEYKDYDSKKLSLVKKGIKNTNSFLFCTKLYQKKLVLRLNNQEITPEVVLIRYAFFYWGILNNFLDGVEKLNFVNLLLSIYTSIDKASSYNEQNLLQYQLYQETMTEKISWLFRDRYNDVLEIYRKSHYNIYYILVKVFKNIGWDSFSEKQQNTLNYLFAYAAFQMNAYDEVISLYKLSKKNWSDETRLWLSLFYKNKIRLLKDYIYTYLKYHSSVEEVEQVVDFLENTNVFESFYNELQKEKWFQKWIEPKIDLEESESAKTVIINTGTLQNTSITIEYNNSSILQNALITVEHNNTSILQD